MPTDLRSSIVYSFACPSCQAGYVGSTTRTYKIRVDEHRGHSSRTGLRLQAPPQSAVRDHCEECGIIPSSDHFKILDSCPKESLRILESLYIKANKPVLNNTVSAYPLFIT